MVRMRVSTKWFSCRAYISIERRRAFQNKRMFSEDESNEFLDVKGSKIV